MAAATLSCRRLLAQAVRRPVSFARRRAGTSNAASSPMMAITTSISTSVNARRVVIGRIELRQRRPAKVGSQPEKRHGFRADPAVYRPERSPPGLRFWRRKAGFGGKFVAGILQGAAGKRVAI